MRRLAVGLGAVLLGCLGCDSTRTLVVQVRTDLAPVVELGGVGVDLGDRGVSGEWDAYVTASASQRWGDGVRVLEVQVPGDGPVSFRVGAEGPDGRVLVERPARAELRDALTVVTVFLTRDCAGVTCPAADPAATACLGARCVRPECLEERTEECGAGECATAGDCPAPAVSCAEATCTASRACVSLPVEGACGAAEVCSTERGCVSTGPAPDAGPEDAGTRDAGPDRDAGPFTACGPGAPRVSLVGPAFTTLIGRVGLATDGSSLALLKPVSGAGGELRLATMGFDGTHELEVILGPATAGLEAEVVYTTTSPGGSQAYVVAWTVDGSAWVVARHASDLSQWGPLSRISNASYRAPSLAVDTRDGRVGVLLERGVGGVAYIDVMPGLAVSNDSVMRTSAANARAPHLFFMDGLFGALWLTDDASPLWFEGIAPGGGSTFAPGPLDLIPPGTTAHAAGWLTGATDYFWVARAETGSTDLELSAHIATGMRHITWGVLGSSPPEEIRATSRTTGVGYLWTIPNGGSPLVRFVERTESGGAVAVDLHPELDTALRSMTSLHADALVRGPDAWYAAVRGGDRANVVRICDP